MNHHPLLVDIADPVDGRNQYGPPCYAHSVATLAMGYPVSSLVKGKSVFRDGHPDFHIYPVMLALEQFEKVVPKQRCDGWRSQLASVNPAKTYGLSQRPSPQKKIPSNRSETVKSE